MVVRQKRDRERERANKKESTQMSKCEPVFGTFFDMDRLLLHSQTEEVMWLRRIYCVNPVWLCVFLSLARAYGFKIGNKSRSSTKYPRIKILHAFHCKMKRTDTTLASKREGRTEKKMTNYTTIVC